MIRDVRPDDAQGICDIYNPYILASIITFEEEPVDSMEIRRRIEHVCGQRFPWIVLEKDNIILGYAYASTWRARAAYRHTAETTIYVNQNYKGRGYGRQLYADLLERLKLGGFHNAIGGISLPNAESVGLHESLGFLKVAVFTEVGFKFGHWVDVGFWQLRL